MTDKELNDMVYSDNPWERRTGYKARELLRDYDSEVRLIALDILLEKGEI